MEMIVWVRTVLAHDVKEKRLCVVIQGLVVQKLVFKGSQSENRKKR